MITKKLFKSILIFASIFLTGNFSYALMTEVGIQYGRKKTTFDLNNYIESETSTGSLSFYLGETISLELSYTESTMLRKALVGTDNQIEVQNTQVIGSDLIFLLAGRKALLAPYLKGGLAQIKRSRTIRVNTLEMYTLDPETAITPSYGAGLKINLSESFGIKLSYDIWRTPIGGNTYSDDSQLRAGVTWIF